MMLFLVIVTLVLWTVIVCVAGYSAGTANAKEEQSSVSQLSNYAITPVVDQIALDRIEELWEVHEKNLAKGDSPMTSNERNILNTLWEKSKRDREHAQNQVETGATINDVQLENGMSLQEWAKAVDTRFTRVERKAGMNV